MLKNLWNILPLPSKWNDEERKFGVRISDALVDLFRRFRKSDKSMETIQGAVAIFANGNTHPAIGNGKYVYLVNHGTLEEGLYKATSAIAENATLSASNLTPASAVLNTIPVDSNLVHKTGAETITGGKTFKGAVKVQNGANEGIISFSGQSGNTGATPEVEIYASGIGKEYDRYWNPRLQFREYSTNTAGEKLPYSEIYLLPEVDNNLATDMWYEILTTKESIANNLTTEFGGMALDARQGKVLNDKISIVKDSTSLGSFSTIATLETLLNNALSSMDSYTCMTFRVTASATVSPFVNTYIYYCLLYKGAYTNNYCHVVMYSNASLGVISGYKTTGSWSFDILVAAGDVHKYFLNYSPTTIPANSDFDDYNTPGAYTVANGATAATIAHCPYTSSGGRLEVMGQNSNTSYLRHIYYPSGSVYIYTRIKGASAWWNWYRLNMTQV